MKRLYENQGFTLFELLIVVTILAILVLVTAVSINAPLRLIETNDVRRSQDVQNILNAVHTYIIDHDGELPAGLSSTEQQIGTSVLGCVNLNRGCNSLQNSCYDLGSQLVDYFRVMPKDPTKGSNSKTFYTISINSKNIVTVRSCGAEGTDEIVISM